MSGNVKQSKDLKNPSEIGTHYRLLCMTGLNKGIVYYLVGKRVIIGRGQNADIQILDSSTSREHAELSLVDGSYVITDLGAQNGIVINDTKIKQQTLINGEKVVIGKSVFKYSVYHVRESKEVSILKSAPETAIVQEIKRGAKPRFEDLENRKVGKKESSNKKEPAKDNKGRTILLAVVLVGGVFVLMGGDDNPKKAAEKKGAVLDAEIFNESVAVKNESLDPDTQKKLDSLIHSGRREFREGNYFRAMEEFRLALVLSPSNGQASYYLSKSKQKLDEEITRNFDKGTQELESKKYQAAIVSFCGVIQLIKEYPNDERYKNADLKIRAIESSLGMEKGEIKCFEERSAD